VVVGTVLDAVDAGDAPLDVHARELALDEPDAETAREIVQSERRGSVEAERRRRRTPAG
jgi:hypothetical protein